MTTSQFYYFSRLPERWLFNDRLSLAHKKWSSEYTFRFMALIKVNQIILRYIELPLR